MEIIWTKLAKFTYFEIIENINNYWNKNQSKNFVNLTKNQITNIESGVIKNKLINNQIRKCIIHKNVSLYYIEDKKNHKIILITFYNNRMNPKTLLTLLNKEF